MNFHLWFAEYKQILEEGGYDPSEYDDMLWDAFIGGIAYCKYRLEEFDMGDGYIDGWKTKLIQEAFDEGKEP